MGRYQQDRDQLEYRHEVMISTSMSSASSSTEASDIETAKSVIGSRTVTTFTNVASNKSGFSDVFTSGDGLPKTHNSQAYNTVT